MLAPNPNAIGTVSPLFGGAGGGGGGDATCAEASFTNGDLVAGVYTFNHALSDQFPAFELFDNNNQRVQAADITATDANNAAVNLSGFGTILGTWTVKAIGCAAAEPAGEAFALWAAGSPAQVAADLEEAHATRVALGELTGTIVGADYVPTEPTLPTITRSATVSTAAALAAEFATGGTEIRVTADIDPVVLVGENNRVIFDPGVRCPFINLRGAGSSRFNHFVGGEVGTVACLQSSPATSFEGNVDLVAAFPVGMTGTVNVLRNGVPQSVALTSPANATELLAQLNAGTSGMTWSLGGGTPNGLVVQHDTRGAGQTLQYQTTGGSEHATLGVDWMEPLTFNGSTVSDWAWEGTCFNPPIFGAFDPCVFLGETERWAFVECVARGGLDGNTGNFVTYDGDLYLRDVMIAGCNLTGALNDAGANNWVFRSDIDDTSRVLLMDSWLQSRAQNVVRHARPNSVVSYTTPGNRGTPRELRYINLGFPNGHQDVNAGGESTFVAIVHARAYLENDPALLPLAGGFGVGGYGGAPFSRKWLIHDLVVESDSGAANPITATQVTARLDEQVAGQEEWSRGVTVVDTPATRPTPPTIANARLLAAGYTGGQPNAHGTYLSDPAGLPTT